MVENQLVTMQAEELGLSESETVIFAKGFEFAKSQNVEQVYNTIGLQGYKYNIADGCFYKNGNRYMLHKSSTIIYELLQRN